MTRRGAAVLLAAVLAASCTEDRARPVPSPTAGTPSPPSAPQAIELLLVGRATSAGHVEGMELATRQVNAAGGVAGEPLRLRRTGRLDSLGAPGGAVAALVVGRGEMVTRLRPEIEAAGAPVIVFGDDLYSSRLLYRQVIQAGIPELWQARALARLLVPDLRLRSITVVSPNRDTIAAYRAALLEEGVEPRVVASAAPGVTARRVAGAEAVILPGPAEEIGPLARAIGGLEDPPLLALGSEGLSLGTELPPGTVAPYHYAWSGWAEPIPRVGRFRTRAERLSGEPPEALQQEGYDAIRLLAETLEATDGRGGEALIGALEAVRDATYSAVPLRLGPDDHVLLPEGQVGVFAVARPGTGASGEALGENPWRPAMRTFTYNGERVTIVRRDIRVFFPRWSYPAPTPEYRHSRYGITSPAGSPPR